MGGCVPDGNAVASIIFLQKAISAEDRATKVMTPIGIL